MSYHLMILKNMTQKEGNKKVKNTWVGKNISQLNGKYTQSVSSEHAYSVSMCQVNRLQMLIVEI